MILTSSLEHLQLEAGYDNCPLHRPFHPLGEFTTPCWLKSLWQSLDCCNIKLMVDYPTIPIPREGDSLVAEFIANRCEDPALLPGLQRCRNASGLLFLSDMTAANGRQVERKMMRPPNKTNLPTTLVFPKEVPTTTDWLEWAGFWLTNLEPGLTLTSPLGKRVNKSHRIWEWFYLEDEDSIIHRGYDNASLFTREETSATTRSGSHNINARRKQ